MVRSCLHYRTGLIDNRYISANAPETDQVKRTFATSQVKCIRWDCVYTSCRTFPCVIRAGSWSDREALCLGAFGFYLNVPSRLDFAAESCGIGRLAKFYGDSDNENDNCYYSI